MHVSIDPQRPAVSRRARLVAVAAVISGVMAAGCGGSSTNRSAATAAGTATPEPSATSASSTTPAVGVSGVAFAECMRASGVPDFADPEPGRGLLFAIPAGTSPDSPAFRAARAKCQKLLPSGGPPGPGSTTHPSAQTLAHLRSIAQCMREHGVPQFPDPRTSVPVDPFGSAGRGVITDYDGAILLFPATLDMHSPAYNQAVAECGTLAGKLGRGPH